MTGNTNKSRAVFLAALMVFSVFAGTVAFTGSAAAAQPVYQGNAVEYENSSDVWVIELPFDGDVSSDSLDTDNFTLYNDDEEVTDVNYGVEYRGGAVYLNLSEKIPSNDLTVDISSDVGDGNGNSISNAGEKSVVFASQTLEYAGTPGTPSSTPANSSVYQGSTVAVNASSEIDVTVEGEDNNYFREGSTGTNSSVYTLNTANRELGDYRIVIQNNDTTENRTFITVRDLELDVTVDDLSVTTEDDIEGTVSSVASGREVEISLLDSSGDEINSTTENLDGQGEYDYAFDAGSADNGEALEGNYTVEVTDTGSGVSVESSELSVSAAGDDDASFTNNVLTEHRGDVFEFTVEVDSTDTATVVFGSSDDGVISNATLVDDDGDGQVTAYLNTTALTADDSGNSDQGVYSLDSDSDDEIDSQVHYDNVSDMIDAGEYDFEVRPGSDATADSTDVATVVLEERGTTGINTWTLPSSVSVSDLEDINEAAEDGELTETSDIANGDKVVHEIQATGLEGLLNAQGNEQITGRFLDNRGANYDFTIEQASPGANQGAWEVFLGSSNTTVVADGDNDTYYVVVNTGANTFNTGASGGALPDDEGLTANFTVVNDDASAYGDLTNDAEYDDDENEETLVDYEVVEPEVNVDEPYNVSNAAEQTVSGDTTLAPGTELRLRVRSDGDTRPSFLKTASPVVQSDGTWSATFDFSEQNVGDTYNIVVSHNLLSSDVSEDGEVVESVSTATPEPDTDTPEPDTDTPEPDTDTPAPDTDTPAPDTDTPEPETETPTSTPGFGVVVALTALLAAALLATRRD